MNGLQSKPAPRKRAQRNLSLSKSANRKSGVLATKTNTPTAKPNDKLDEAVRARVLAAGCVMPQNQPIRLASQSYSQALKSRRQDVLRIFRSMSDGEGLIDPAIAEEELRLLGIGSDSVRHLLESSQSAKGELPCHKLVCELELALASTPRETEKPMEGDPITMADVAVVPQPPGQDCLDAINNWRAKMHAPRTKQQRAPIEQRQAWAAVSMVEWLQQGALLRMFHGWSRWFWFHTMRAARHQSQSPLKVRCTIQGRQLRLPVRWS